MQFCSKILQMEEEYVKKICNEVIAVKPDLVITEKGVSDLAQHFLVKAGISCIRRVRKSDNNRIARQVKGFVLATFNSFWENKLENQVFSCKNWKLQILIWHLYYVSFRLESFWFVVVQFLILDFIGLLQKFIGMNKFLFGYGIIKH